MVGNTSMSTEVQLGRLLAPYLADPSTAFVISSDFAHWGLRFRYTFYRKPGSPWQHLTASAGTPKNPYIHESIKDVDFDCISACESGNHMAWLESLEETSNTVCGRHPIGVMMAAVEEVRKGLGDGGREKGAFKFVRYERSGEVKKVSESSVSYASAFAVI
jgi:MEMO1 family protein